MDRQAELEQAFENLSQNELEAVLDALTLVAGRYEMDRANKGIYLKAPYGELIASGEMKCFAKPKRDERLIGPRLLLSDHKAFGVMRVGEPVKVDLGEFDELIGDHCIGRKERMQWWPEKEELWLYPIDEWKGYEEPIEIDLPPGVQGYVEEVKGGAGSGHHGHSGRPGKRGGSVSRGASLPAAMPANLREAWDKFTPRVQQQLFEEYSRGVPSKPSERDFVRENYPELAEANSPAQLLRSAVDYFGTTRNFREAGYITPDGDLLDLSGKKQGASPGIRNLDHRDVSSAMDLEEVTQSYSGTDLMTFFQWQTNSVRFSQYGDEITISLDTPQDIGADQWAKMREALEFGGNLSWDIYDQGGSRVSSEYIEGADPNAISRLKAAFRHAQEESAGTKSLIGDSTSLSDKEHDVLVASGELGVLSVQVASTPLQAQKGFSNRDSIDPTEGLLIPISDGVGIWMRDTTISLGLAFLDSDFKVLQIDDLTPNDETVHLGPQSTVWALEASPEWFKSTGVEVGDRIGLRGGPGSGHRGHGGRPGKRGGSAPTGAIPKKWIERGWEKSRFGVLTREEGNKSAWIRKEIMGSQFQTVLKKDGLQWVRESRRSGYLQRSEADAVALAEQFFKSDEGFIPDPEWFRRLADLPLE